MRLVDKSAWIEWLISSLNGLPGVTFVAKINA